MAFNLFPTLVSYRSFAQPDIQEAAVSPRVVQACTPTPSHRPQVVSEDVLVLYQFLGNMVRTEERDMGINVERRKR